MRGISSTITKKYEKILKKDIFLYKNDKINIILWF
jgi:hypothetical protein